MTRYQYFVSYAWQRGFGNTDVTQDCLMTSAEHIRNIEKAINVRDDVPGVVVLYFALLREQGEGDAHD